MYDATTDTTASQPTSGAVWHAVGVLVLIAATWVVYYPSLGHAPRGDQWWFLRETSPYEGCGTLISRYYSYNRSSVYGRGDFALFRPVLFALLCAEQALFGPDFTAWQCVGIVLHLAVVLLLLVLLLRLRLWLLPGAVSSFCPLAYCFCLFFSLNVSLCESVIWSHINGYMLFVGFCLAAVLLLLPEFTDQPARRVGLRLVLAWVVLALASFTHEVGPFFAVVFALVLAIAFWRGGRRTRALMLFVCFALLLPIYQVINRLDLAYYGLDAPFPTVVQMLRYASRHGNRTLFNFCRYPLFTLVQPFFPSCIEWSYAGRVHIAEPRCVMARFTEPGFLLANSCVGSAVLLVAGLKSLLHLRLSRLGRTLLCLLMLPVGLGALQTSANVLGRLNFHSGPGVLISSCYYCYLPMACLLLILYSLWQAGRAHLLFPRWLESTLVVFILVVTVASALQTHEICSVLKKIHRPICVHTHSILRLLNEHRHDPGFRFSFDPALFEQLERDRGAAFPEILFPCWIDHVHPTFVFVLREGRMVALSVDDYCRQTGRSRFLPLPELVPFQSKIAQAVDKEPR